MVAIWRAFRVELWLDGLGGCGNTLMWKRLVFVVLLVSLIALLPVAAQQPNTRDAADYIPADFAGFIRLRLTEPGVTVQNINAVAFAAQMLQPNRVALGDEALQFDTVIPFIQWFNVDGTSFVDNVLPWVEGEMALAYRQFDGAFETATDDILLVLPVTNYLNATSALSPILNGQDLGSETEHRSVKIYIGDRVSYAITSTVVFIGPLERVKAGLDVQAGAAEPISAQPAYRAITEASPADAPISAYIGGDYLLPAINGLLNGQATSEALLQALGGALTSQGFVQQVLDGSFDGAGVSLRFDTETFTVRASAYFHSSGALPTATEIANPALLEFVPRNALLVHSGSNFTHFLSDAITSLPMTNFARELIGGLGIQTVGTASGLANAPSADDLRQVVSAFSEVMKTVNRYDLQADLFSHVSGSYTLAILPRPNNPLPLLNTPFDVLIVTEVDDPDAAQSGVTRLLQTLYGLESQPADPINGWSITTLGADVSGRPIFTIATQNDKLILTTGNAIRPVLAAEQGDDRLVNLPGYQDIISQTPRPDLYVDLLALYNTFFQIPGGVSSNATNQRRMALGIAAEGDQLLRLDMSVLLPRG